MASWIDILVPIVVTIIIIAVSIYLFTIYCHPEQKGAGNALLLKVLVILSQVLAWSQILLLPLDQGVEGSSPDSTFYLVYYILYPIIFALIAFLNPFALFYYESDPTDSVGRRVCWSAIYAFIVTALWCGFTFISYVWLSVYDIGGVQFRLDASLYILLILSLVGWFFLALNGAIGLVYLPYELIVYFINKPQPLSTEQGFLKKTELQTLSNALITQGEKLQQKGQQLKQFEGGWFSRRRAESQFSSLVEEYKKKINKLEKQHERFDSNLKVEEQRSPALYIAALIFGCISVVVSVFWVFQILGHIINPNGQPLYGFMDDWFSNLANSGGSFIATILYGILVIYMQICLLRGNMVFGFRVPYLFKIHPMIVNKTYMNAMLFNCNLMLLASCSISFQALWSFPLYFAPDKSYLALTYYTQILRLPLFGSFYGQKIPLIVMECIVLVVIVFVIVRALWRRRKQKSGEERASKDQK